MRDFYDVYILTLEFKEKINIDLLADALTETNYNSYSERGEIMEFNIRPSADLRNKYNEISKQCKETREPVIITVHGRGDTTVLGLQNYKQMRAELELLRTLAEAEDDVQSGRLGSMQKSFDDLRDSLVKRKDENV